MATTTWRKLISEEMERWDEDMHDVIAYATTAGSFEAGVATGDAWLDVPFNDSYGTTEGCEFTLWTSGRVYFPVQYDGKEWCASVPRYPCGEITPHVGGG